jgi:hypothetical protein
MWLSCCEVNDGMNHALDTRSPDRLHVVTVYPGLSLKPLRLYSILPMQSTAGLKKRSPFTFTSDEDHSPTDAGVLDDQRKSPCARGSHRRHPSVHLTLHFRAGGGHTNVEGGERYVRSANLVMPPHRHGLFCVPVRPHRFLLRLGRFIEVESPDMSYISFAE